MISLLNFVVFNCAQNLLPILQEHVVLELLHLGVLLPDADLALPIVQNPKLYLLLQPVDLVVRP